jgi:hypothetical protein
MAHEGQPISTGTAEVQETVQETAKLPLGYRWLKTPYERAAVVLAGVGSGVMGDLNSGANLEQMPLFIGASLLGVFTGIRIIDWVTEPEDKK